MSLDLRCGSGRCDLCALSATTAEIGVRSC